MEENRNTPEVTTKPSKSFAEIANIALDWIKKNKVATIAIAVALVMTVGFILALAIPRNTNSDPVEAEMLPRTHGTVPELNVDQFVANLENAGYKITYSDEDSMLMGQTHNIYAENDETGDNIEFVVYENAEYALASYRSKLIAVAFAETLTKYSLEKTEKQLELYRDKYTPEEIEAMEKSIQSYKESLANYESSVSYGCVNNVIWVGTAKAAEDSRTK